MTSEGLTGSFPIPAENHLTRGDDGLANGTVFVKLDAFNQRWAECRVSFRAYLSCWVPDSALVEDCLQDLAVLMWQKGPLDRGREDFLAYGLACARRIGPAAVRKRKIAELQLLAPDVVVALADTLRSRDSSAEQTTDRIAALRSCLDSLEPKQRELLDARYAADQGASMVASAKLLGRSLDSLYKQLERLRTVLRHCIAKRIGHAE